MAEDKLKRAITRAQHVQGLLNDSELTAARATVVRAIHSMWEKTASEDRSGREALYREIHGLNAVWASLEAVLKNGKLAEAELEHQRHGD